MNKLAYDMAEMAAIHNDDQISNALSRVSQKLERLGSPFSSKLSDLDKTVIKYYLASINK